MIINRFRVDGREILVEFTTGTKTLRLTTFHEPKAELFMQTANVAAFGKSALGIIAERAAFREIAFSHGDSPGTRLVYKIPTLHGENARLTCPRIDRGHIHNKNGDLVLDDPRTLYEDAVILLEQLIEEFVRGERAQLALPFEGLDESEEPVDADQIREGVPA